MNDLWLISTLAPGQEWLGAKQQVLNCALTTTKTTREPTTVMTGNAIKNKTAQGLIYVQGATIVFLCLAVKTRPWGCEGTWPFSIQRNNPKSNCLFLSPPFGVSGG